MITQEHSQYMSLRRSRCQLSHTVDGFCQQGHQRAAQWRAFLATWLSWGRSVQWQARSERCTPSRASWPGTLHCDSPGDSTRHPGDTKTMFETSPCSCVLQRDTDKPQKSDILWTAAVWHCCPGSRTWGHGGSDLCSRNCRSPAQWTAHSELCCEPGSSEKSQLGNDVRYVWCGPSVFHLCCVTTELGLCSENKTANKWMG